MFDLLLPLYIACISETTWNRHTLYNLPVEQCKVIYTFAQDKCYTEVIEPLADICEAENPICSYEILTNVVDYEMVCREEL